MRQKANCDREMAARLALEEKMSKFSQDRSTLEEKAKVKEKEAQELKATLESTNKSLVGEQLINQSLKEELHGFKEKHGALIYSILLRKSFRYNRTPSF